MDDMTNSADKTLPVIPKTDSQNNANAFIKMDQMIEEGASDLKLLDGFDGVKSEILKFHLSLNLRFLKILNLSRN